MTDYKLPDLPSDDELGITEEDLRAFEEEQSGRAGPDAPAAGTGSGASGGKKGKRSGSSAGAPPSGGARTAADDDAPLQRARWKGPLTLLALIAVGWVSSIRTGIPEPLPATAPDTAFSAARAMAVVQEIARAPRPTGSPEHARVRALLLERLQALGLDPEVQTGPAIWEAPGFARAATARNVVARIGGSASTGAILLIAHYDGTELSPAAGDNASGVATLLEVARVLGAGPPLRNDVILLFTDAEEIGLLGAELFARDHPWMAEVRVVLNFEMRGSGGPSILFETSDGNAPLLGALRAGYPRAFGTSMGDEFFRHMPYGTDFSVFERHGARGLNFAAIDNAAVYHTPRDLPSELSPGALQHHGVHAMGALRRLGSSDLSDDGVVAGPDQVYFTVPAAGLVTYPVSWVVPLAVILLLAAIGTFWLAARRGARPSMVVVAGGMSIIAISLGYAAGQLLVDWASGAHAEAGRLPGALFYGEGWYVLGIVAAALFIVSTIFGLARAKISTVEATLGAVSLPIGVAAAVSFAAPMASAPLVWPALAVLCGVALHALLGARAEGWLAWTAAMVLALPGIALLLPALELVWLAGTLRSAGPLGAAAVLAFLMVYPAIDALRTPNRWWLPLVSLAAGAAFVGLGRLGSDASPLTPIPTTLVYAYEHGSAEGLWASDVRTTAPGAPSETWLAERVGAPFEEVRDLVSFGYLPGPVPVAVAPAAAVPPPTMTVLQDTTVGLVRQLRLAVRSEIGAERIHVRRGEGAGAARITAVNGVPVGDPYATRWIDHWGDPEAPVVFDVESASTSPIELAISEHHLRPADLLGPGTFQRPPGLEADAMGWSDRAILVTRFVRERGAGGPPTERTGVQQDMVVDTTNIGTDTTGMPDPADTVRTAAPTAGSGGLRVSSDAPSGEGPC